MENFEFCTPTKFILEKDADLRCGQELKKFSNRVLFVHYGDPFTYESGLYSRIKRALKSEQLEVFELAGVQPNPKLSLVREGIRICREKNIGAILAVGGGSVIDTAKAIGIGVPYHGDVWDFYEHVKTPTQSIPVGVVMTLPATGSEGSNGSVINNDETGMSSDTMSDCIRPSFSLMNPDLTLTLPRKQTVFGIVDMFSHCLERYFCNSVDCYLTDAMGESVMKSIIKNARILMNNLDDYNSRAELMWTSIIAHNGLLAVGRQQDWATHAIGAQLSARYNAIHGATLSILFPNWAKYVYKNNVDRFAQFARQVFDSSEPDDNKAAQQGIAELRNFFNELGAPSTLREIRILDDSAFKQMAELATRFGNIGNIMSLSAEDVTNIYRMSF